jgi:hypothetical protein
VVWYEKNTVIGFEVEEFSQDGPSQSLMGVSNQTSEEMLLAMAACPHPELAGFSTF